jgi:hypothetical protein
MKPSEIIKLARRQTWCTEDIVTTDEAYKFLNFVIEDFGSEIRTSDSWYWFDVLEIPVTAWQPAYTFENDEELWVYSEKFPISKIQSVWLLDTKTWKYRDLPVHFVDKVDINKFENQWEPKVCFITRKEINLIPMPKEDSSLQIWGWNYNQPIFQDIWKITVNSVEYTRSPNNDVDWTPYAYAWEAIDSIIYTDSPKPTTWNAYEDYKWTTLAWTIDAYDVEVMDSEDNIWIDKRWHYVIVEWLKYRMYGNMWVNFEAARNNSRAFYDSEKNKAIQNIVDRWQLADTAYFPNLNFLNY